MLLSYNELCDALDQGVLRNALRDNINGASIDVRLGPQLLIERPYPINDRPIIDLAAKESPHFTPKPLDLYGGWVLDPGDFVLAATIETFHLPNDICCEFKLKSSVARSGIEHSLAGWGDPGWSDATLTLELRNTLQHQALRLEPGMKIGQVIFWRLDTPVPDNASYSKRGQYNGQKLPQPSKGIR